MKELTKHKLTVNGNDVYYWQNKYHKDRESILLIHGFTGTHYGFYKLAPSLTEKYNLVIPDLPGFGISDLPAQDFSIDDQVKYLKKFIDTYGFDKSLNILGHSYGALLVSKLVEKYPIFNKVILISPPLMPRSSPGSRLGSLYYKLASFGTHNPLPKSKIIADITTFNCLRTNKKQLRKEIYDQHRNNLEYISSPVFYSKIYDDINKTGAAKSINNFRQKNVFLIHGDADNVAPHKYLDAIKLKGVRVEIVKGAGHLMHYENPRILIENITDFIG